jgi:hypothetical protein
MRTIIKTAPTSNFTIIANDLINSDMPAIPYRILSYLLSKPDTWQVKPHDLRKQLGLTAYAVKKGLRWLCSAGFAAWTRLKSGHCIWRIFDKPQTAQQAKATYKPVSTPQVEFPQMAFQPVLIRTETEEINKPLPAPPEIPESLNNVVVDFNLIYPVQLTEPQKKVAKHIIKKVKQPELQQDVLFALAYAIAQGTVKSAPAYLHGLVKRANSGTFEPVGAATATNHGGKPLIPIWEGFGQSTPSKPEVASGFIQQARAALRGIAI